MANKNPGLSSDNSIYLESIPGDGGNHTNLRFWASQDIEPTGPIQANTSTVINVHVHCHPNTPLPPSTDSIVVRLYVGNPSLTLKPIPPSTKLIGETFISDTPGHPDLTTLIQTGTFVKPITWNIPSPSANCSDPNLTNRDPDCPGHNCLIAWCYPSVLNPGNNFFLGGPLPDDPHVAQRNITIVPVSAGSGELRMPFHFQVEAVNPQPEKPILTTVGVYQELRPDPLLEAYITDFWRNTFIPNTPPKVVGTIDTTVVSPTGTTDTSLVDPPGTETKITNVVTIPARGGFKLKAVDFPEATVVDRSRFSAFARFVKPLQDRFGLNLFKFDPPEFSTKFQFPPQKFTTFDFEADLSDAKVGQSFVFDIKQTDADGNIVGGYTVIPTIVR